MTRAPNEIDPAVLRERWRRLDERFAAPMWFVSLASLASLAVLLHFHQREEFAGTVFVSLAVSAALWLWYAAELLLSWRVGSPRLRERLWCCVLPPLRLAARDHETGRRVWLPGLGWQPASRELRDRLERVGSVPMMVVAVLVLPLIALEFAYADDMEANPRLAASVAAATALIWFAFTFEFVVLCSLADRKLKYCREHWLDLAIILLPLLAFLRALRLGRLLRLQQLSRTARVYKLRGTLMRAWRALLVLEIVRRLIHGRPERRLERLAELIAQKELELAELHAEMARLRATAADAESPGDSMQAA
jgi:voltage-gated potassium channel